MSLISGTSNSREEAKRSIPAKCMSSEAPAENTRVESQEWMSGLLESFCRSKSWMAPRQMYI